MINGKTIKIFAESQAKDLPWKEMGVDIVIESTEFILREKSYGAY